MFPGHWKFFFRCHAVGTKTKSYDTLTWTSLGYDPAVEQDCVHDSKPDPTFDEERVKLKAWNKFAPLSRPLADGPVSVVSRGKELVIAAGYVSRKTFNALW